MFRIPQVTKITCIATKTLCSRPAIPQNGSFLKCRTLLIQRLYSSDKKGGGDKKDEAFAKECPPTEPSSCSTKASDGPCPTPPSKKVDKQKSKDPGKSDSFSQVPYEKPKIQLRECRPIDIKPCQPLPPDCGSKIPPLNECNTPNLMNDCPEPKCPWEEQDKQRKTGYRNVLILGILFTIATLAALYKIGLFTKPETKEPKKKEEKKPKRQLVKQPPNSSDIPNKVPYLLIGGGTASFSAFRAIKSADPLAKVLVISNEDRYPYMRPPLSKEMWFNEDKAAVQKLIFKQWNGSERSLFYEPDDFYTKCQRLMDSENGGVAVALGWTVKSLDPCSKTAYLEDDYAIQYDKCLIATGATPKTLSVFEAVASDPEMEDRVSVYRNVYDFEDVYETFEKAKKVAIIGGGFLGSELACALARKGKKGNKFVYQVFREPGNMGKILPEYLSYWTTEKVKAEGVEVMANNEVVGVKPEKGQVTLTLSDGELLKVDHVIVAVGVQPNTQFAEAADLEVDPELGGYLVNTELMARSNLYVAGDCACFYDAKLGRRRIEHHDHAVVSGRLAGENMAGGCSSYVHQSMFWSDLGPDVGYEAIGIVDSSLPTVGVFAKATDKDNPKAVVMATDEGIRSKTEEVPPECKKYLSKEEKEKMRLEAKNRKEMSQPQSGEDFGKGVIFYLRDDIVVGIVLWNVFNRMSIARQVLKDEKKYDDLNEVAKLFNIHEE